VLVASFATLQVYYMLNYPGMSAALPLAVALYTAGAAGYLRWALLVAAWFVAGPIVFRLFVDPEPVLPVLAELLRDASLWLATLLLGDAVHSRRALSRAYRLLEVERARSDGLLRNMLPEPIAGRLKQREEVIADAFGEVTVLFADIVDFTEHAERSPPEATVALLNELFSQFDGLTEARGLEKIKTVGDAYMVAGGLPDPMPDHAGAAAEVALEMLEFADRRSLPDGGPVRLRIGIASGPVVAGVIGRRRFSYDLWGDTVNTASRMETTGVPGCIQVTERTRELLGDRYLFQERGMVQVKGKGTASTGPSPNTFVRVVPLAVTASPIALVAAVIRWSRRRTSASNSRAIRLPSTSTRATGRSRPSNAAARWAVRFRSAPPGCRSPSRTWSRLRVRVGSATRSSRRSLSSRSALVWSSTATWSPSGDV
jgi:class 3 adenylate cyclase